MCRLPNISHEPKMSGFFSQNPRSSPRSNNLNCLKRCSTHARPVVGGSEQICLIAALIPEQEELVPARVLLLRLWPEQTLLLVGFV